MAAYALVRFQFFGREVVSVGTLLMRMVPPAVLTVPVFMIWTYEFTLSNSLAGVILVYTAINLPFVIWILQSFIAQVRARSRRPRASTAPIPIRSFSLSFCR